MALDEFQDVAVHYKGEYAEQENEADLHKPFFYGDAQIVADDPFNREQQNMASIQNGNGKEVEQTEVEADDCHQTQQSQRPALSSLAGNARNPDDALQFANGNFA